MNIFIELLLRRSLISLVSLLLVKQHFFLQINSNITMKIVKPLFV